MIIIILIVANLTDSNVVMGIHSLNWASMLKDLSEASSNEKMRERAIQKANYVTSYLQPPAESLFPAGAF